MIFDTNATPDRYISSDRESILYYEMLEEQRFKVEITLIKRGGYFLPSLVNASSVALS